MRQQSDQVFGRRMHARRETLGLTLTTLSSRSGVSAAMLSEVERGRKSPTLRVATQIAEGLRCAVSDLLVEDAVEMPPDSVAKSILVESRRERRKLVDAATGIERQVLAPRLLHHGIEVVWYVVPPGKASELFAGHRRGVVAHATIVRGMLDSITPIGRHRLRPGDSITYPAELEHSFRNPGRTPCEFLLVIDGSRA
jgi:transcriptional regulator with XRE-family HTH domain